MGTRDDPEGCDRLCGPTWSFTKDVGTKLGLGRGGGLGELGRQSSRCKDGWVCEAWLVGCLVGFLGAGSSTFQVTEAREQEASADFGYIRQSSGARKPRPANSHFLLVEARPVFW